MTMLVRLVVALSTWVMLAGAVQAQRDAPSVQVGVMTGHSSGVHALAFSPDGRQVISGSSDYTLRLWDVASGRMLRTIETRLLSVFAVAVSPDGRQVIAGGGDIGSKDRLQLWDVTSGRMLRNFQGHRASVWAVAFSPDGRQVISGAGWPDNSLRLWDVASGRTLRSFKGHSHAVDDVAFSPDGRQVISGSRDKTLRLWDVASGRVLRRFEGHSDEVKAVAFSPTGQQVISGSLDKTLRLWDVASGQMLRSFEGHSEQVTSVAFSPDGRQVISASYDKTLRLWDVASGRMLQRFEGHSNAVLAIDFSPDGRQVISGSHDDTLRLWGVAESQLVASGETAKDERAAEPSVIQPQQSGEVHRGWLGVQIQSVTDDIARDFGLREARGALVSEPQSGGPAAKAGIKSGDVVVSVNGEPIKDTRELAHKIAALSPDTMVRIGIVRGGREQTLDIKLGKLAIDERQMVAQAEPPEAIEAQRTRAEAEERQRRDEAARQEQARAEAQRRREQEERQRLAAASSSTTVVRFGALGLEVSRMTPELQTRFKVGSDIKGLLITKVEDGGPAATKGIKAGEVIVEAAQKPMSSPEELQTQIDTLRNEGRSTALLLIATPRGDVRFATLPVAPTNDLVATSRQKPAETANAGRAQIEQEARAKAQAQAEAVERQRREEAARQERARAEAQERQRREEIARQEQVRAEELARQEARLNAEAQRQREQEKAASSVARPAVAETRVALVIGNSAYAHLPALSNPRNDAEDLAAALRKLGFEVKLGLDLGRTQMEDLLAEFAQAARRSDTALAFFAGHGIQHAGVNYLAPVDVRLRDETDLRRFIRVQTVLEDLQNARGVRILILDACRDNDVLQQIAATLPKSRSAAFTRGLARIDRTEGTLIAFATQPERVAQDGHGTRNSPFTAALLKHLPTPGQDVRILFTLVRAEVLRATGGQQRPEVSDSLDGLFALH